MEAVVVENPEEKDSSEKRDSEKASSDASEKKRITKEKKELRAQLKKLSAPSSILLSPLNSPISLDNYEHTLNEWKDRGGKLAFIYEYVIDKYRKLVSNYGLAAFIIISLTTLLSLSNLGIKESDHPEIALGMKIATAILTSAATIASGVVQLRGWQPLVTACQKYLDTVENFVAIIISEQTLPLKFRTAPDEFILGQKDKYQSILSSAPDIPHDDYVIALEKYSESKNRLRSDLIAI